MKRSDELIDLSREHHTALRLAQRLQRGDGVTELRAQLSALLTHFAEEEHRFAHVLDASAEDRALYRRLKQEHVALEHHLRQATFGTGLTTAGELLSAHVRFEERELFPHIESLVCALEV